MVEEEEKREGKGFKVEDRRRFSPETGEARDVGEKAGAALETGKQATEQGAEAPKEAPGARKNASNEPLPEINFSTFVISLSTQVLMHLGEIPNPMNGKMESDLAVAKQMIDIIAMLRQKTQGNLDSGEQKLVEDVLFDLRMKYVEAVKK